MEAVYVIVVWLILATVFGFLIGRCISFGSSDNTGRAEENVES